MRQVEPETLKWREARNAYLAKLQAAQASGDFSQVPMDPLETLPGGTDAPLVTEMTAKVMQGYAAWSLKCDEQISVQQQIAILEAARRARVTQRSSRAVALRHWITEAPEAQKTDTIMVQDVVGIRKARA